MRSFLLEKVCQANAVAPSATIAKTTSANLYLRDRSCRGFDAEIVGAVPGISDTADISMGCSCILGSLAIERARSSVKSFARAKRSSGANESDFRINV